MLAEDQSACSRCLVCARCFSKYLLEIALAPSSDKAPSSRPFDQYSIERTPTTIVNEGIPSEKHDVHPPPRRRCRRGRRSARRDGSLPQGREEAFLFLHVTVMPRTTRADRGMRHHCFSGSHPCHSRGFAGHNIGGPIREHCLYPRRRRVAATIPQHFECCGSKDPALRYHGAYNRGLRSLRDCAKYHSGYCRAFDTGFGRASFQKTFSPSEAKS